MSNRTVRNTVRFPLPLKAAVLALALNAAMIPSQSRAADITVDSGGACTLAEAITSANNDNAAGNGCIDGSGADTITLEKDVTLSVALPDITSTVTIKGREHTINGDNRNFSVLTISTPSGDLTLNEATVTGGNKTSGSGGGIYAHSSTVTLNSSTVSENSATTGCGITAISSIVTLNSSTISENSTNVKGGGGIAAAQSSTVTLNSSTVSGNSAFTGGGIYVDSSTVTLNSSTVSGNSATGSGGGAFGSGGGIIAASSLVILNSSTVSGNTSYSNSGGGIFAYSVTMTLNNSIVSGNTANTGNEIETNGIITADSYNNVFGDSSEPDADAFTNFTPGASDVNATSDGGGGVHIATPPAAILSPLADNGGPTQTHALPAGSPAIDLDTTCVTGFPTDQRGYSRPIGAGCDAGSFEFCADNPCGCGRDLPANTWLMTAPSCTPVPTGIDDQYGTDLGGTYGTDWISFEWLPESQDYNTQAGTAALTLGEGNWNYSTNAGTLFLNGTATPTEACSNYGSGMSGNCFAADLTPSGTDTWQLVGNPFPYTVDWADVRIAVNSGSWTVYKPGDAQTAAGYVNAVYHTWNGSSYQTYDDSTPG